MPLFFPFLPIYRASISFFISTPLNFSQRANAIVEGEKAALAVMPQIRERVAQLQAERAKAAAQAQQKAAESQYQACLDNRSRLQKLAGLAKLDDSCPAPK